MHQELAFTCGEQVLRPRIDSLIFASAAQRDRVPELYPVVPALLSQAEVLTVFGDRTVPEVEFVLFGWNDRQYVTVGNDQSDLSVERSIGPAHGKNVCGKLVAQEAWDLTAVIGHWDSLRLRLVCNGRVQQDEPVKALLAPARLQAIVAAAVAGGANGRMIFSGTVGTVEAVPPHPYAAEVALVDPVLGRVIRHAFRVTHLPVIAPAAR